MEQDSVSGRYEGSSRGVLVVPRSNVICPASSVGCSIWVDDFVPNPTERRLSLNIGISKQVSVELSPARIKVQLCNIIISDHR